MRALLQESYVLPSPGSDSDHPLVCEPLRSPREAGADPSGPCPKQGSAEIGRPSERSRLSRGNSGHFIVAQFNSDPFPSQRSMWRQCMRRVLRSSAFDASITSVVFFNFVLLILDSDARAEFPGSHGEMLPPTWVARLMDFCFAFFALEFVIRLSCEGRAFFRSWMSIADMTIIVAGLLEYILLWIGSQTAGFNIIRVARLCRLVRLMRVFRLVAGLAELRRLVQMMAGCFKTLFWSSLLLCLVMTIWSVIAVELINPYIQAMVKQGAWPDCDRCRRSFASVFMSNLTLFQTVVAGNSWGLIALPVIEEHPEVVLVFAGSRMTLVFGVLNLIVAVIVDTFAENRLKDVNSIAKELDIEESNEKKTLGRIFEKIDLDGDGALSYDELVQGATKVGGGKRRGVSSRKLARRSAWQEGWAREPQRSHVLEPSYSDTLEPVLPLLAPATTNRGRRKWRRRAAGMCGMHRPLFLYSPWPSVQTTGFGAKDRRQTMDRRVSGFVAWGAGRSIGAAGRFGTLGIGVQVRGMARAPEVGGSGGASPELRRAACVCPPGGRLRRLQQSTHASTNTLRQAVLRTDTANILQHFSNNSPRNSCLSNLNTHLVHAWTEVSHTFGNVGHILEQVGQHWPTYFPRLANMGLLFSRFGRNRQMALERCSTRSVECSSRYFGVSS